MPTEKRYYWLKLKRDFFKRHDIEIVEAMPNGKDYVLFYLKLLIESIDHEGTLRFSDTIPYDEQMISVITRTNIDIVRSAMKIFEHLNLVEIMDDKTIYLKEAAKLLGCEIYSAERMRNYREKQESLISALHCDHIVQKSDEEIEIEKERELEIDKERESRADKPPKPTKVTPCLSPLDDALKRFADHRKKLKSPMTENAISLLIKKLSTLSDLESVQIAIIDQSILNGWKGVFPIKSDNEGVKAGKSKQVPTDYGKPEDFFDGNV